MDMGLTFTNQTDLTPYLPAKYEFATSGALCLIFGATGIVCNILILVVVHRNKKLHTPCFYMMACQAFFNLVMGVSFATDGIHRIGYVLDRLPFRMTEGACLLIYFTKNTSHTPSALITCGIGLDRLLAITVSKNRYFRAANAVAKATIVISVLVGVIHEVVGILTAPAAMNEIISCLMYFSALNETFATYICSVDLSFFVVSILIYSAIILKVNIAGGKFKMPNSSGLVAPVMAFSAQREPVSEQDIFVKKQLALIPLIRSIMLAFILVGITPQILSSVAPHISQGRYQIQIVLYESILRSISTLCDFGALMIKCQEFRRSLIKLIRRQEQSSVVRGN